MVPACQTSTVHGHTALTSGGSLSIGLRSPASRSHRQHPTRHTRDGIELAADVGKAVVSYLRDRRRRVPPGCRTLFLSVRAPEGPMTSGGVSDVVTRLARRAGMSAIGPHLLRHGAPTQLLRHGSSWPELAQVLRHSSISVTATYATIDPAAISELARPWPGAR